MPDYDSSFPPEPAARGFWRAFMLWLSITVAAVGVSGALLVAYALVVMVPKLPPLDALIDYRPAVPLRIYTADHVLIGEFGVQRRQPVRLKHIPDVMKKAVLAIEDARFYAHGGVDYLGIARAGLADLLHGSASQGASTITMQLARNFFLTSEKTYTRKLYEALLAWRIESALTKDQILEIYMNQIYLGQRAYGFAVAARVYFGKELKDVTLAQAAMLAGLPKAPSAFNPIVNPKRAKVRQAYILKRMLNLRYIDQAQYEAALNENLSLKGLGKEFRAPAQYAAEMVRRIMVAQYQDEAYTRGLSVITTLHSEDQIAAYHAVRRGIVAYEQRHPYRGPEAFIHLPDTPAARDQIIENALLEYHDDGALLPAVVESANTRSVQAKLLSGETLNIQDQGLSFAAPALSARAPDAIRIRPGAVIRVRKNAQGAWSITQLPQLEGALIAMTPQDGAIRALVGGFDFNKNKFNHVTQAWRQPGSSFKPFIYSAALEKGFGPATVINDAPLFFSAAQTGGRPWAPKNIGGVYDGPITLRTALKRSKNMVSIRILNAIRPKYAQKFLTRFGFYAEKHPAYLPMALGSGEVTPMQMAVGFAVFANGGYRVNPYLILEVSDQSGAVISRAQPLVAGKNAPRVIDERNAWLMTNLLQTVAQHGTGARTNALKRSDLAGKTGTTNDSRDVWFAGFQRTLVAVNWMGYDQPKDLGKGAVGAALALPVWIDYMGPALRGIPEYSYPRPAGIVEIDGEFYFDHFTPGHGFVRGVDVNFAPPSEDENTNPDSSREAEQTSILDIFRKP